MRTDTEELRREALALPARQRQELFESLWPSLQTYGIEFRYNNNEPLVYFSRMPGGVWCALYRVEPGSIRMNIEIKTIRGPAECSLGTITAGDTLSFRYLCLGRQPETEPCNMGRISTLSRPYQKPVPQPGCTLGLDIEFESSRTVRISGSEDRSLVFRLSNGYLKHATASGISQSEGESWHWRFPDVHPNQTVSLKVVETDWNDPPSSVEPHADTSASSL
jgi:hypothetical protein